VAGQMLVGVMI